MTTNTNPVAQLPIPQLLSISGMISDVQTVNPSQRLVLVGGVSILIVDDSQQSHAIREGAWLTAHASWSPAANQWQTHGRHTYNVMGLAIVNPETSQAQSNNTVQQGTKSETTPAPQPQTNNASTTLRPVAKQTTPATTAATQPNPVARPAIAPGGARTAPVMKPAATARPTLPHAPRPTAPVAKTARSAAPLKPVIAKTAVVANNSNSARVVNTAPASPTQAQTPAANPTKRAFSKQVADENPAQAQLIDQQVSSRSQDERFSDPYWQNKATVSPMGAADASLLDEDIPF